MVMADQSKPTSRNHQLKALPLVVIPRACVGASSKIQPTREKKHSELLLSMFLVGWYEEVHTSYACFMLS